MFNNRYITMVQKTSGFASESLGDSSIPENDEETVTQVLQKSNVIKMKLFILIFRHQNRKI